VGFPSVAAFATRPFVVASFLKWFDIQGFDPAEVCGYNHNIMCSMDLFHIFSEEQRMAKRLPSVLSSRFGVAVVTGIKAQLAD